VAEHAATRADLESAKTRLADLEATLRTLNGTLETLTGELAQSRRELAAAAAENGALRTRVAQLESAQAATVQAQEQARAAEAARLRDDPQAVFTNARGLVQGGQHAQGADALEDFLARFPGRPEAAEANYWLGESLLAQDAYADAAQAYIAAIRGWPKTDWAPDAVVKLSSTLVTLKQPVEACKSLAEWDWRYAAAPAAVKARARQTRTAAKCG
jgi:tol-pal system protein YbgF